MHIILSVITALGGLIWAIVALQRSGFDINSLNPFLWHRHVIIGVKSMMLNPFISYQNR